VSWLYASCQLPLYLRIEGLSIIEGSVQSFGYFSSDRNSTSIQGHDDDVCRRFTRSKLNPQQSARFGSIPEWQLNRDCFHALCSPSGWNRIPHQLHLAVLPVRATGLHFTYALFGPR
jgi:hypothetical protein